MRQINAIIRLRRDNDYNFESIKNSFIPASGEVVFVDTATTGLRAKVGDGVTTFANLNYLDENAYNTSVIHGYFYNNHFYAEMQHQNELVAIRDKLYIDRGQGKIYSYDGTDFIPIENNFINASDSVAGIAKLYDTTGQNTDGSITQRLFTTEIEKKCSVSIDENDDELLIFSI